MHACFTIILPSLSSVYAVNQCAREINQVIDDNSVDVWSDGIAIEVIEQLSTVNDFDFEDNYMTNELFQNILERINKVSGTSFIVDQSCSNDALYALRKFKQLPSNTRKVTISLLKSFGLEHALVLTYFSVLVAALNALLLNDFARVTLITAAIIGTGILKHSGELAHLLHYKNIDNYQQHQSNLRMLSKAADTYDLAQFGVAAICSSSNVNHKVCQGNGIYYWITYAQDLRILRIYDICKHLETKDTGYYQQLPRTPSTIYDWLSVSEFIATQRRNIKRILLVNEQAEDFLGVISDWPGSKKTECYRELLLHNVTPIEELIV